MLQQRYSQQQYSQQQQQCSHQQQQQQQQQQYSQQQGQKQQQQYSQQQQQQQQANAQQTWSTVTADADIIEEALREYAEEVQENFVAAASGVADGDLQPSWEFLKRHKGVVATVVLPAFLVFRFPGPVLAFIRFIPQIAGFVLAAVIYSSRVLGPRGSIALLRVVWTSLWPLLVSGMQTGVKDAALKAQAYTEKRRAAKTGPGGDDDGAGGSGGGGGSAVVSWINDGYDDDTYHSREQ